MYVLFSGKQWQLSQFHKKSFLAFKKPLCTPHNFYLCVLHITFNFYIGFGLSIELNLLKPLYVHIDHSGTFHNYNARSKFPSHSSTLMKNPFRWGGGGGRLLLPRRLTVF